MGWSDGGEGATGDEQQEHTAGRTSPAAAGQGGDYQSQGLVLYKRRRFVFKSASPEDDGTEKTPRKRMSGRRAKGCPAVSDDGRMNRRRQRRSATSDPSSMDDKAGWINLEDDGETTVRATTDDME